MKYLEDFQVGQRFDLGGFSLKKEDMVAFAERYDPQPFHLQSDPNGVYGGLIASGWQTGSECHLLLVNGFLKDAACLGSPGVTLRFAKPVRADTAYTACYTITEVAESKSRPDRGRVTGRLDLTDPDNALVYSLEGITLMAKRPSQ